MSEEVTVRRKNDEGWQATIADVKHRRT